MKNGSSKCCLYFHLFFVANTKIIFGYNIATPLYKHLLNSLLMQKQSPEVFRKKSVLRNFAKFTEKHLCQSLFFNKVAGLRQLCQTLAQVICCEFCEMFKNTFFTEHLRTTASLDGEKQYKK